MRDASGRGGTGAPETVAVTVRLFGVRRELTDRPSVTVAVPAGSTVRDLLERLGEELGPPVAGRLLIAGGRQLGHNMCLALNGRLIRPDALDTPLGELGEEAPEITLAVVFGFAGGCEGQASRPGAQER